MAEPHWELWEQILQGLHTGMATVKADVMMIKAHVETVGNEVKGLRTTAQMALGTASGAEFVAEQAQQAAERATRRVDDMDARLAALEETH